MAAANTTLMDTRYKTIVRTVVSGTNTNEVILNTATSGTGGGVLVGKQTGMTPVLNIANDIVVNSFLKNKISFVDIPNYIEDAMNSHPYVEHPSLDDVYNLIEWTGKYFSNINKEVFSSVD